MPGISYAHSFRGKPEAEWEPLDAHLAAVGELAMRFGAVFGWGELARVAGLLHDIGKCSADFKEYLRRSVVSPERLRGPDHSTAGARVAIQTYQKGLGTVLAHVIAGHHCGLADWDALDRRLDGSSYSVPAYGGWRALVGELPLGDVLLNRAFKNEGQGFALAFLIRMLFSALVDADSLATEAAVAAAEGSRVERGGYRSVSELRARLAAYMNEKQRRVAEEKPTKVNALRAQILGHVLDRSGLVPGLFTLTVPTGGGKTLASLSFALEHAVKRRLRRVVFVIPYVSIIEQTADVAREALGADWDVLEHHANFDWDRNLDGRSPDAEESEALKRMRLASENWDVPVVVTTAVQFYESLFSNRRSRCRKLHNLADSVVIVDEAHMTPLKYLLPCMSALKELANNYGASVVLCSATSPALRIKDGFENGFEIDDSRELAPDAEALYESFDRFGIDWRDEPVPDDEIVARFAKQDRMLVIVNTRAHAKVLFAKIQSMEGACHLSTLMCPAHRRKVLSQIKADLDRGRPVRLVSTSLVECGVDVDFPEVWRAASGLDAILQAGGRCNREGGPVRGKLVVFQSADTPLRREDERQIFWNAAIEVRRTAAGPLNRIPAIKAYFSKVYWRKDRRGLDSAEVMNGRRGILPAIEENKRRLTFPFSSIASSFVMIDDEKEMVVVPWRSHENDKEIDGILARIAAMERPLREDLRRLQQYSVGIPKRTRDVWLKNRVLVPVNPAMGDAILKLDGLIFYNDFTGLSVDDPEVLPSSKLILSEV